MSIVVFSSSELKETGQSLAISALATYMAIEHNQKMLIVATDFKTAFGNKKRKNL